MSDVMIICHQKATEVDGVIDLLRTKNLFVERLNLCQYPEHESHSWSPNNPQNTKLFEDFKVVWWHNSGLYSIVRTLEGHGRELALRDCQAFWEGMALTSNVSWLNSPTALLLSSKKLLQLSVAHTLKIPTPPTIISNDITHVRSFFNENDGAVVKSLANGYSVYGKENLKLYTRFFPAATDSLLAGLPYGPMIFQKYIPKIRELRVTAIDKECFGMIAETNDLDKDNTDIRRLDYRKEQERFSGTQVPDHIIKASLKIIDYFGLSYASLDWAEDITGQWYFLELNSMGSFKWSELRGAGNISKAIANALFERVHR